MTEQRSNVGAMPDGSAIERFVISRGGLTVSLLNLGAILQDVRLAGVPHSLTIGTDHIESYLGPMRSAGSLIGPVVNRISGGRAVLDGQEFLFDKNQDNKMTRHSGSGGTHRKLWECKDLADDAVSLQLRLPDGEGGFPGTRDVSARFTVLDDNVLEMSVRCSTDKPTWVNFANHSYWNLDGTSDYAGHTLYLAADRLCVADQDDLATGDVASVSGTFFDFREPKPLQPGKDPKIDCNFCVADARRALTHVLTLTGQSGVQLDMETTEPGVQLYDGNGLTSDGAPGHNGAPVTAFGGLAIEAQAWPDAPNQPSFPSIVLRPGETYEQITRFRFSR